MNMCNRTVLNLKIFSIKFKILIYTLESQRQAYVVYFESNASSKKEAICVLIMSLSISYFSLTSGITADFCHLQGQENADISTLTDYRDYYYKDFCMGWMASIYSRVSHI